MEAKKATRKNGCVHRPKKGRGLPQCFALTHRHSDTGLEGSLRGGSLGVLLPTVTQFESASRQPLRVALRISASSPQGPKVRSPFVAPSCYGFLRLHCVSFARPPFLRASPRLHRLSDLLCALPLTHNRLLPPLRSFACSLWCCSCASPALLRVGYCCVIGITPSHSLRAHSPRRQWTPSLRSSVVTLRG